MTINVTEKDRESSSSDSISPLQAEAWMMANRAYHVPDGEPYLELGRALYERDLRERLDTLLARLDEQNAQLDDLIAKRGENRSA